MTVSDLSTVTRTSTDGHGSQWTDTFASCACPPRLLELAVARIAPAIMPEPFTVLIDSSCLMCNRFAYFVVRRDPRARFMFGALEADAGDSIQLIDERGVRTMSSAVLFVLSRLSWPWPLLAIAYAVPRPIRDAAYALVARHRHRFLRGDRCPALTLDERRRFLPPRAR